MTTIVPEVHDLELAELEFIFFDADLWIAAVLDDDDNVVQEAVADLEPSGDTRKAMFKFTSAHTLTRGRLTSPEGEVREQPFRPGLHVANGDSLELTWVMR